ncbi:hypothetical protein K491DRAFT_634022 [Lophiostoma macrostomum CBS 122681]|uniref:Uncharacterized protein n=1 Tax=Lophiostoma macrostomum CBS 122681 TaxID=1314788 RepID=A0A6A6T018_9PLEO|nr:hypothetical protein K491DRAFT_634022 [Lophiostoma macrostomum CBS 122681]
MKLDITRKIAQTNATLAESWAILQMSAERSVGVVGKRAIYEVIAMMRASNVGSFAPLNARC